MMHDAVSGFHPSVVVVDPISNLSLDRSASEVKPTLMRLIDFLKQQQITTLFTSLTAGGGETPEDSQLGVSSLMDTWLLLRNVEFNGERNRTIYVLKSRGMAHSNQVREFVLSDNGIDLVDVYLGAERVLLFAYEESSAQIVRNMGSIGIDLAPWVKKGLLQIHSSRPTLHGLEQHLVMMHDAVSGFHPSVVVVDPISNLSLDHSASEVKPTLMRLIDFLKQQQITTLFTSLTAGGGETPEDSQLGVSSLMDTWLLLRNVEFNGERNRTIYVLKSRGMAHSNQVREFVLSDKGIDLVDVYLGTERVLTGTARVAQEELEGAAAALREEDHRRKLRQLASRKTAIEAQIAALRAEAEAEAAEVAFTIARETLQQRTTQRSTDVMAQLRSADKTRGSRKEGKR